MKLDLNFSKKKLSDISNKLIRINKIKDGYIRPIVFRSSNSMSPETKNCKTYLAIAAWKWGTLFNNPRGISLTTTKYPKLSSNVFPIHAKSSGSYQVSVIARVDAHKKKYDDCLMLDLKGNIAETTACNIFWIKNKTVYTPKEHSILKGITRKAIINICKKNWITKCKKNEKKIYEKINSNNNFKKEIYEILNSRMDLYKSWYPDLSQKKYLDLLIQQRA